MRESEIDGQEEAALRPDLHQCHRKGADREIIGYHWIAGFGLIDSLLEATTILGGMGPVKVLATTGAKLFASGYPLFSGSVFIAVMGIVLASLTHRMLHAFHIDEKDLPQ